MKKLKIISKLVIKDFKKINDSLTGKQVFVRHQKYPEFRDVVKNVKKMPGINTKQVCFMNSQPIIIREGDRFEVEVLS